MQYDPTGDHLAPQLQGSELVSGEYVGLAGRELATGGMALWSRVLGLELRLERRGLRFYDPASGEHLLTHAEADDARESEKQARQTAERAAAAAQARVAELEARLAKGREF